MSTDTGEETSGLAVVSGLDAAVGAGPGYEEAVPVPADSLSAPEVLELKLPLTPVGRRGIQPVAVAALQRWASAALTEADRQIRELRGEVDRLNAYIREQWDTGRPPSGHPAPSGPAALSHALELIARAQQVADERVARAADAESQARLRATAAEQRVQSAQQQLAAAQQQAGEVLGRADAEAVAVCQRAELQAQQLLHEAHAAARRAMESAREQYEQILTRAHRRAEQAAATALEEAGAYPDYDHDPVFRRELELRATYLRTLAQVSRTTLRATLEATRQEFGKLTGEQPATTQPPTYLICASGDVVPQSRPAAFSAR